MTVENENVASAAKWVGDNRGFVSLLMVCGCVIAAIVSATWWASKVVHSFDARTVSNEKRLAQVENGLGTLIASVGKVREDLGVKPSDVLREVREMKAGSITREDVRTIVLKEAPWSQVSSDWREWKQDINEKIEELKAGTSDRWSQTDHDRWVRNLQRLNPDMQIPE